jgi:hypothetical protein
MGAMSFIAVIVPYLTRTKDAPALGAAVCGWLLRRDRPSSSR